jgi:hypothetical protein
VGSAPAGSHGDRHDNHGAQSDQGQGRPVGACQAVGQPDPGLPGDGLFARQLLSLSEVLGITIYSHRDLEQQLRGFNAAYNIRRQRVLDGKTPDQVVAERIEAQPTLSKPKGTLQKRESPCDIAKARFIAETAKGVSRPDN